MNVLLPLVARTIAISISSFATPPAPSHDTVPGPSCSQHGLLFSHCFETGPSTPLSLRSSRFCKIRPSAIHRNPKSLRVLRTPHSSSLKHFSSSARARGFIPQLRSSATCFTCALHPSIPLPLSRLSLPALLHRYSPTPTANYPVSVSYDTESDHAPEAGVTCPHPAESSLPRIKTSFSPFRRLSFFLSSSEK
ncbi:uncharacterized protein BDZ99DRAFT_296687 [Mytilinidion resinicola]|uniref:REJ domain-containing protein n=1 Tax=Mytilinidion resinicola TaxID=574789 RepID=A0A6A6YRG5_9PEZI|nr:uncharacterized protein BDZ99DRAFT_296687 [Mytilinidion resinicola]KAF2811148.1 hypothetical protein BDZ99DRAFT_296687 [Mytilinidion resinicola]